MKKYWKVASVHLLLILSFLSIPVLSSPDFDYSFRIFEVVPFLENFTGYLFIIGCFYVQYYVLLPRLFVRKKITIYVLSLIALFLLLLSAEFLFGYAVDPRPPAPEMQGGPGKDPPFMMHYLGLAIPFVLVVLFSHTLFINHRAKQIELDNYRAELKNLKYQLQPHFLFNSLNNIYAVSIVDASKTPDYILKLSEILRFLLSTENLETVNLKDDIAFCQRYIDLQSLRFGESASQWDIYLEENPPDLQIPPFLLIPIIENIFKYGIHPDKPSPIYLRLEVRNNKLSLITRNRKNNSPSQNLLASQKLGLTNTRARLNMIFPTSHSIEIHENNEEYVFQLHLLLS